MGLAIALLEEIKGSGCLLTATTHYPEIKDFAAKTPGFCNARMAFDHDTLMPLYRLEIGLAGESCALHIAERLGLPRRIVERAHTAAYGRGISRKPSEHRENAENRSDNSNDSENGDMGKDSGKDSRNGDNIEAGLFKLPDPDTGEPGPSAKVPICSLKPGDSIRIKASGKIGVVYAPIDDEGNVGVQIQDRKLLINHKRIRLFTPAEDLYPDYPNHDLSIVLDTVANRKARHKMGKGHFEGNVIIDEKDRQ
jgi:dsDNA-specific endonuclease/ATPase MutS2